MEIPENNPIAQAKRTRTPHKEGCICATCKLKREKELKNAELGTAKEAERKKIIDEYVNNLPAGTVFVKFDPETMKLIGDKLYLLKEKYKIEDADACGNKLMNEAVTQYLKPL